MWVASQWDFFWGGGGGGGGGGGHVWSTLRLRLRLGIWFSGMFDTYILRKGCGAK